MFGFGYLQSSYNGLPTLINEVQREAIQTAVAQISVVLTATQTASAYVEARQTVGKPITLSSSTDRSAISLDNPERLSGNTNNIVI